MRNQNALSRAILCMLLVAVAVGISSCDSNRVFEGKKDFEDYMWHTQDVPSFTFTIDDTTKAYNLYYNLRYNEDYLKRNLYIQHYLSTEQGLTLEKELLNVHLFHPVTGKPRGHSSGSLYNLMFPALEGYTFSHAGTYTLSLEQYMQDGDVAGIVSAGVRVETVEY